MKRILAACIIGFSACCMPLAATSQEAVDRDKIKQRAAEVGKDLRMSKARGERALGHEDCVDACMSHHDCGEKTGTGSGTALWRVCMLAWEAGCRVGCSE